MRPAVAASYRRHQRDKRRPKMYTMAPEDCLKFWTDEERRSTKVDPSHSEDHERDHPHQARVAAAVRSRRPLRSPPSVARELCRPRVGSEDRGADQFRGSSLTLTPWGNLTETTSLICMGLP